MYDAESRRTIVAVDAAIRETRMLVVAPTCERCLNKSVALNSENRCVFCEMTSFLFRANGHAIQRFIWEGVTVW